MLLSVNPYPTIMSFTPQSSPPKRPRLSLQIKTPASAVTLGKSSTALKSDIDPSSPTAFNTLSNAYATAIENASPRTAKPPTDLRSLKPTSLRVETKNFDNEEGYVQPQKRTQTPGPFTITYPDTPSSALAGQTPVSGRGEMKADATSFAFTPPQSAGAGEQLLPRIFTFDTPKSTDDLPSTPRTARRRAQSYTSSSTLPYTHPRTLHSILRNSPLPPPSTIVPLTPSRSSLRIASRAAKKVEYQNPLTQTITTARYIKSHVELLAEDSPFSANPSTADSLDLALAATNETRDGGQTPGPFEEMRRRMADSELETDETQGLKKRKRKEKKRKWEWTITEAGAEGDLSTPLEEPAEKRNMSGKSVPIPPSPLVDREASVSTDSELSEPEERFVEPATTKVVPMLSIPNSGRALPKLSLPIPRAAATMVTAPVMAPRNASSGEDSEMSEACSRPGSSSSI